MSKTPRYRTFDDRRYKFHIRRLNRHTADADARKLRENHQLARVVQDGIYWVVYKWGGDRRRKK